MRLRLDTLINRRRLRVVTAAAMLTACAGTQANEVQGYGFESAAQEITQLFWLAETANVCAWATRGDADWFKLFSVRFLLDHLSERNRLALVWMVTQDGYGGDRSQGPTVDEHSERNSHDIPYVEIVNR